MPVNFEERLGEVTNDATTSLLVGCASTDSCTTSSSRGGRGSVYFCTTSSVISVPCFPSDTLGVGFTILGGAHCYRMALFFRTVTAFSPGYHVGTTIPGLKVEPSVPGHRAGTKEGPLVPVGVTNRD